MSAFPDWEKYAIPQQRPSTGCIPTGYEMILRAVGDTKVNFVTFQDDFDLDKNIQQGQNPQNSFYSVAIVVKKQYPHVNFKDKCFDNGSAKLKFIEERINKQQPVLASISKQGLSMISNLILCISNIARKVTIPHEKAKGCHIMPVVDATDKELFLLNKVNEDGTKEIFKILKEDLVFIHDNYDGGKDLAFLDI